jgi:hypothetical protein
MAVTTIGLLASPLGYEAYDPNNATTPPLDIIGWLINEENGKNVSHPLTTAGDPPAGWQVRYRSFVASATKQTTDE